MISLVLENNSKSGLSFQLNEEITIFKEINFSIKKFNNNHLIVVISHVYYSLEPYRRIITFIDEKQSIRWFVYNFKYFIEILKGEKFKLFKSHGQSKDSLSSEFDETEIYNYYLNDNIKEIKKIETYTKQLIIHKFDTISNFPKKISDLSLNMKYYNPFSIENLIIYLDDLSIFKYNKLKPFLINRYATILFYFGIKGSGKTTQLLYASYDSPAIEPEQLVIVADTYDFATFVLLRSR